MPYRHFLSPTSSSDLKFLHQNGREFGLHYVSGPVDTAEVTACMRIALRQDISLGQLPPAPWLCACYETNVSTMIPF